MSRAGKAAFYAVAVLCWAGVVGLGLELFERVRLYRLHDEVRAFRNNVREEGLRLPDALPEYTLSAEIPKAERERYLRARGEIALLVDETSRILGKYAPVERPMMLDLAQALRPGVTLTAWLDSWLAEDLRLLIDAVLRDGNPQVRDYTVAVGSGEGENYEIRAEPYGKGGADEPALALIISPSIWIEPYLEYRPHVYKENLYGREEFWTNGVGFRDDEVALPKPAGVYRIVCIGGSTTVEGPRNDYTYPNVLERRLQERFGDSIEVVNCGIYGSNAAARQQRIDDFLALEPDLILHYSFVNELNPMLVAMRKEARWWRDPLVKLWWAPRVSYFIQQYASGWFLPSGGRLHQYMDRFVFEYRRALLERARAAGVTVAFSSFARPELGSVSAVEYEYFKDYHHWSFEYPVFNSDTFLGLCDLYNRELKRFCDAEGALYLPVAEQISAGAGVFEDLVHMYLPGIRKKAAVMAEELAPFLSAKAVLQADGSSG